MVSEKLKSLISYVGFLTYLTAAFLVLQYVIGPWIDHTFVAGNPPQVTPFGDLVLHLCMGPVFLSPLVVIYLIAVYRGQAKRREIRSLLTFVLICFALSLFELLPIVSKLPGNTLAKIGFLLLALLPLVVLFGFWRACQDRTLSRSETHKGDDSEDVHQ